MPATAMPATCRTNLPATLRPLFTIARHHADKDRPMHHKHRLRSGHLSLRKNRHSLPQQIYLVTTTTKDRAPFFAAPQPCFAASRCFENPRVLGDSTMLCWVLMPDHVHWLVQLGFDCTLDVLINRLKSSSARHANQALQRTGALWESAFHDRALRSHEDCLDAMRYVIENPERARLVGDIGEYAFWNSVWV